MYHSCSDHFAITLRNARYSKFIAASSLGNDPRVLMILCRLMCSDSTALVV